MISPPSESLMQPGAQPCPRFVLSHLEDAACRLGPSPDAPRVTNALASVASAN